MKTIWTYEFGNYFIHLEYLEDCLPHLRFRYKNRFDWLITIGRYRLMIDEYPF